MTKTENLTPIFAHAVKPGDYVEGHKVTRNRTSGGWVILDCENGVSFFRPMFDKVPVWLGTF